MRCSRENGLSQVERKRIRAMASFYTEKWVVDPHQVDGWLDAFKRRWPDATQIERILAHRLAQAIMNEREICSS